MTKSESRMMLARLASFLWGGLCWYAFDEIDVQHYLGEPTQEPCSKAE